VPIDAIAPRQRIAARGRPFEDPGCAGCRQLPLLRALRRAGLIVDGGLGCEPSRAAERGAAPSRTARVAGAVEALVSPRALVESAAGHALLAVADRGPHKAAAVTGALAGAGARVVRLAPEASAAGAERLVAECLAQGAVALVSLVACARGERPGAPRLIEPARCNRCGSCLALGCVAISDPGGDALVIDPALCTGCGQCAPLCRGRAIAP
jgi:NAD-dependent dihydropyrimidine dehydrogenase PreA subunit